MKEITKEKQEEIVRLYYMEGLPRDDVAKMSKVGEGTVSNVAREVEGVIGKANAEAIRAQAVARRKAKLKFEDDNHGAELVGIALDNGILWETAKKLFTGIAEMSAIPRLAATTPEQLANATANTINVAISGGIQITEVSALVQQKVDRIKSLDIEIDERNRSRDEAKLKQEKALSDAKMNLAALAAYQEDLKLFGIIGMADRKKAAKVMERMHMGYGWDYTRMVEDFSSNETLRQKYERQRVMIGTNDKRLKDQAAADAYHRLVEDAPLDLKQKIVSRFNRLSVQEGMPPSMVWVKCLWDIDWCYHDMLSLPRLCNQMMREYRNLDQSITMKRAQMSFTDAQFDEYGRMKELKKLGQPVDIVVKRRHELIGLDKDPDIKKDNIVTQAHDQPKLPTSDTLCIQSGITFSRSGSINLQSGATYNGAESSSGAAPGSPS